MVAASRDEVRRVIWYRRAILVFSGLFVVIGAGVARRHGGQRRRPRRVRPRWRSSSRSGSGGSSWSASVARKVRGFERVLDAPALFAVAYDEIGSSIYFALGIVAAQALGLTPVVLLATGILFLVVSLSYAEGTAAIPETGGAATFTRRAFNDLVGFATGWVLLPRLPDRDRAVDAVPAALPRGGARRPPSLTREPVGRRDRRRASSPLIAAARLVRHTPHPRGRARARAASTSPCSCSSSYSASRSSSRPRC